MNESERVDEIRRVVVRVDDHEPLVVRIEQSSEPAADGRFSKVYAVSAYGTDLALV
jgi:hypothetical protein